MSDLLTLAAPEVRTYPPTFELREMDGTDSGSMLSGLAVPYSEEFEDVGWYFERFRKGVFAKSIREAAKGLPLLMFHDSAKMPVGVSVEWREANSATDGVRTSATGMHVVHIAWGRMTRLLILTDSAKLEATLHRIAAKGTAEALAAPIADGPDWP